MITIDRSSSIPVPEQLAEQLRYRIVSGVYNVGDRLPATRIQAKQLGISFHTVRKAYQRLVEEGMLESLKGSGYRVSTRTPLSSEEQLEQGAAIVQQAVQRLVGLGLDETEIEYLVQEQLSVLDVAVEVKKSVFVAPYLEMAEHCVAQIADRLEITPEPAVLGRLTKHLDADYFFCLPRDLRSLSEQFPSIDMLGAMVHLTPETLDRIARLFNHETLGLLTFYAETIPHLMAAIQDQTGFDGQIFGASLEDGSTHLNQFIDQTDLIVYTPRCKRRVLPYMKQAKRHFMISHHINEASLAAIQRVLPTL